MIAWALPLLLHIRKECSSSRKNEIQFSVSSILFGQICTLNEPEALPHTHTHTQKSNIRKWIKRKPNRKKMDWNRKLSSTEETRMFADAYGNRKRIQTSFGNWIVKMYALRPSASRSLFQFAFCWTVMWHWSKCNQQKKHRFYSLFFSSFKVSNCV